MVGYMPASVPRLQGHRLLGVDGVDGTSLRCLLGKILVRKKDEEEEQEKKRLEVLRNFLESHTRWQERLLVVSSARVRPGFRFCSSWFWCSFVVPAVFCLVSCCSPEEYSCGDSGRSLPEWFPYSSPGFDSGYKFMPVYFLRAFVSGSYLSDVGLA